MSVPPSVIAASLPPIARPAEAPRWEIRLGVLPLTLVSGVLSAWTLVLADTWVRSGIPPSAQRDHFLGAFGLYAAVGGAFGALMAALVAIEARLCGPGRDERVRTRFFVCFYGVVAALASISTSIWTFSGEKLEGTPLRVIGPIVFSTLCGLAGAVGSWLIRLGFRSGRLRGRLYLPIGALLFAGGAFIGYVDLTWYVALYPRLHTLIELVSALCLGAAFAMLLARVVRWRRAAQVVRGLAIAIGAWCLLTVVWSRTRAWFDDSLKHVWLEEAYVGRMLRRLQVAEAFFSDPLNWPGMHMARIARLKTRYGLTVGDVGPEWSEPLAEPPAVWDALRQLRGGQTRYDVIVYYVDSLRHDAAADPAVMPALREFAARSLDFRRAYAVGSDTLRSLPALTGGNFDVSQTPDNDFLRVARRSNYESTLIIAKSAHEFLAKLRPEFSFERARVIEDYPAEQQVWGYGAQQPTAKRLVDGALQELDKKRNRPLLLWLFNFDQHNWAQLSNEHIEAEAKRFGLSEQPGQLAHRYRVVARSIDNEFGRLIRGLEERKRLERTVVLFVSDHGESLGRDGFWMHSVFLWEPLIRVPLVLHAPKIPAKVVQQKVSLVDVAPTLGRYLDPVLNGRGFHGQDLLGHVLPEPPRRRLPLLVLGASKDVLVRIGFVDPVDEFKLVLSLEAALPELYDLRLKDPDEVNVASLHQRRVRRGLELLVRTPIFPRSNDDFEVRDTREQKAAALLAPSP